MLQPRERGVVEEPPEPAQADHDRLPHGVLALVGEPFEERQQVGRREVAGDDRVPRVVDEVVALERVERAERVARQTGAQGVVVGDAEERVPSGVDDDGGRRVSEREARLVARRGAASRRESALRTVIGTAHSVADSDSASNVNGDWRTTSCSPSREAVICGKPGCQIHESMMRRTGAPLVTSIASHRSLVSVLE